MTSRIAVCIKSSTWTRDSHGLFDYESPSYVKNQMRSSESIAVLRRNNQVFIVPLIKAEDELRPGVKVLAVLLIRGGNALLLNDFPDKKTPLEQVEKMWLVVKSLHGTGYRLNTGEAIRLGRVFFRVVELVCEFDEESHGDNGVVSGGTISNGGLGKWKPKAKIEESPVVLQTATEVETKGEEKVAQLACKVCLLDTFSEIDPLLTPCKCKGTMRYIHLECLQKWVSSKVTTRERGQTKSYSWADLECGLCKSRFPECIVIGSKTYRLMTIPEVSTDHITLETVQNNDESTHAVHVIPLENKNNVRLGRSHDSDVRISDISVSRNHALIRYLRNGLYLEDNESKFGTLVQIRKPVSIEPGNSFSVQCGCTILNISCRRVWNLLSCLGCGGTEVEEVPEFVGREEFSSDEERGYTEEAMRQEAADQDIHISLGVLDE